MIHKPHAYRHATPITFQQSGTDVDRAAGLGRPAFPRHGSAQAVGLALLALGAGEAMAVDCTTQDPLGTFTVTQPVNDSCVLTGGVNLDVKSTGSITASDEAVKVTSSALAGSIGNAGTITGSSGIYIDTTSTVTGGITNSGLIYGTSYNGIRVYSGSRLEGGITNAGTILGGEDSLGIYAGNSGNSVTFGGGIFNSRLIQGGTDGVDIDDGTNFNGGIHNSTTGTIMGGSSDYGIEVDESSTVTGSIINEGIISAGSSGLKITSSSAINGGITNSGTISAPTAILIGTNASVEQGITNTGLINGLVTLGGAKLHLNGTTGRVTGAVTGVLSESAVTVNGTFTSEATFAVGHFEVAAGGLFNMADDVTLVSADTYINHGTVAVAATDSVKVLGDFLGEDYQQSANGVFRTHVTNLSTFGKLSVDLEATLAGTIDVVTGDPSGCGGITANQTLSGVITAGTLSGGLPSVTDDCTGLDFSAVQNGNAVDLITQLSVPGAPTITSLNPGDGQILVAFNPPTSGGPPTQYTATCISSDGGATGTATGPASPLTVTALTNGKTYTCTVVATNSAGSSSPSTASSPVIPQPPTPIPTLSQWAMILLGGLLAALGVRRRQRLLAK